MKTAACARKRTAIIVFLAFLLFPLLSAAAGKKGQYGIIIGADEATCGSYVIGRDEGRAGDHLKENQYSHWVAGYVTAYNLLTPDTYDIMGTVDMSAVLHWLENYCKQHPQNSFALAVENLTAGLYPNRAKGKP